MAREAGRGRPKDPKFYGVENQDIPKFQLCDGFSKYQSLVDDTTSKISRGDIKLPEGV